MKETLHRLVLETLEERIFFDANPVALIADVDQPEVPLPQPIDIESKKSEISQESQEQEISDIQVEEGGELSADAPVSIDQNATSENEPQTSTETSSENNQVSGASTQEGVVTDNETDNQDQGLLVEQEDVDKSEVTRIVFLDNNIQDFKNLLQGVAADISQLDESFNANQLLETHSQIIGDTEIIVLDHTSDELSQITDALADYEQLDSVHLFSYGSQNSLVLGDTTLTTSNLEDYSTQISGWGKALSENGDFLLYGCNIAQDITENNFIEAFAQLTEADVAASDDQTGNQAKGGDWDLEVTSGEVESTALQDVTQQWDGLLDPAADSTLATDNSRPMINSTFDFEVAFNNTDLDDVGYGPFIDIFVPATVDVTGGPEYLGQSVAHKIYTWDADGGTGGTGAWLDTGNNEITTHPLESKGVNLAEPDLDRTAGHEIIDGDKWYVIELPFGSFTPDQPIAEVEFEAKTSTTAQVGEAIMITSRAGFQYGTTATNDNGPLQEGVKDELIITPQVIDIEKSNNAPEGQTATGPSYPVEYTLVVNVAANETVEGVTVRDYLPENAVYRGDVTITPLNGSPALGAGSISQEPNDFVVLDSTLNNRLLEIDLGSVTGVNSTDGKVSEYEIKYTVYFSEVQSDNTTFLLPNVGDDSTVLNESSVTGTYQSATVSDGVDVGVDLSTLNGNDNDTVSDNQIQIASIVTRKDVSVGGDGVPAPGKVLTWTINVDISDYYTADGIVLNDVFGDGQTFANGDDGTPTYLPQLVVHENGSTNTYSFDWTTCAVGTEDGLDNEGNTALTFNVSTLLSAVRGDNRTTLEGAILADPSLAYNLASPNAQEDGDALNGRRASDATYFTITYQTVIDEEYDELHQVNGNSGDASVDIGDKVQNDVTVVANIKDRLGAVEEQTDTSADHVIIPGGNVLKEIYAINGFLKGSAEYNTLVANGVQSGDEVTYRLKMDLPSADFENLIVKDFFPLPVYDVNELTGGTDWDTTGSGNSQNGVYTYQGGEIDYGPEHNLNDSYISDLIKDHDAGIDVSNFIRPDVTISTTNNMIQLDFGSYDATNSTGAVIDVLLTLTIEDEPRVDELWLTNQGEWSVNDTNVSPEMQVEIVPIKVGAPEVNLTKGVVGKADSNGVFTPATIGPSKLTFDADGAVNINGALQANDLIGSPVDADLENADGGDLVTFAITVYNTGGDDAYDINVKDTIPTGFTTPADLAALNLKVYSGTNNADINSATLLTSGSDYIATFNGTDTFDVEFEGLALIGDPANRGAGDGSEVFVITYQLVVDNANAIAGSEHTNTARVDFFTGIDNDPRDWTETVGEPEDDAKVSIALPTAEKVLTDTSLGDTHTTGANVVIGEMVKYTITVDIPEGTTEDLKITDNLGTGLAFVEFDDQRSVDSNLGLAIDLDTALSNALPSLTIKDGGEFTINLGDVTNTNSDNTTPDKISFSYWAVVLNTSANTDGETLTNNVTIQCSGVNETTTSTDVEIVEADLEVVKDVGKFNVGVNPVDFISDNTTSYWKDSINLDQADENIAYRISIQHTNTSHVDAFDVTFTDILPNTIWQSDSDTPSFSVSDVVGVQPTSSNLAWNGTNWVFSATWNELDYNTNESSTFVFSGGDIGAVSGGVSVVNTGIIEWESMPDNPEAGSINADTPADPATYNSTNTVERTGDGTTPNDQLNNYKDTDNATITVNGGIDKILSSESTGPYSIGDQVSYDIKITLPEGNLADLIITDELPPGMSFVSYLIDWDGFRNDSTNRLDTVPTADPTIGNTGNIVWDFTGRDNPTNPIQIFDDNDPLNNSFTIKVTCQIDEIQGAGINEENDTLSNHALMNFGGGTADVEDPSDPTITVSEPEIVTTKTVVNSRDGGTDAILGELLTYTVQFENDGSSTAFEVTALDTLPAGVDFQAITSAKYRDNSGSTPVDTNILGVTTAVENYTDDATQSTVTFGSNTGNAGDNSWDIKVGDYIELTYTVKVIGAGLTAGSYENVIDADWSSQNGNTTVERVYEDTGGTDGIGGNKYSVDERRDDDNATFNVSLGSIGDLVWYDANENGAQEAGGHEPGIANVDVTLTADLNGDGVINVSDGDIEQTTTTAADGSYLFDDLLLGEYENGSLSLYDYKVEINSSTVPSNYEEIYDKDGISTPHLTSSINLDPTVLINRTDIDFGYTDNGSIGDTVWFDANADGVQNANEPGLAGVEVTLVGNTDNQAGNETISVITDSNGHYIFSHLPPGNYSVSVDNTTIPDGMIQTYDLDGLGSQDIVNTVALASNQQREDVDFGYTGTGSIGDTVWIDSNKNGAIDNGEQGIAQVTVSLEADFNNDGQTDYTATKVTDASGQYLFTNLPAGSYQISIVESSLPGRVNQTYDLDGVKDHKTTITLGIAEDNLGADFGYFYSPKPVTEILTTPPSTEPYDKLFTYDNLFRQTVGHEDTGVNSFLGGDIWQRQEQEVFQQSLMSVSPIYSGHAEPGTTLRLNIYDSQGNVVGSQTVMADSGGNWMANFSGTVLMELPHRVEIGQSMASYNQSTEGGFNMRTYFSSALGSAPYTNSVDTVSSVFATLPDKILQSIEQHYRNPTQLGWNNFYGYEFFAPSTNPSQNSI